MEVGSIRFCIRGVLVSWGRRVLSFFSLREIFRGIVVEVG